MENSLSNINSNSNSWKIALAIAIPIAIVLKMAIAIAVSILLLMSDLHPFSVVKKLTLRIKKPSPIGPRLLCFKVVRDLQRTDPLAATVVLLTVRKPLWR